MLLACGGAAVLAELAEFQPGLKDGGTDMSRKLLQSTLPDENRLKSSAMLVSVTFLIGMTVIFEFSKDKILEALEGSRTIDMVKTMFNELTVLGFLMFVAFFMVCNLTHDMPPPPYPRTLAESLLSISVSISSHEDSLAHDLDSPSWLSLPPRKYG